MEEATVVLVNVETIVGRERTGELFDLIPQVKQQLLLLVHYEAVNLLLAMFGYYRGIGSARVSSGQIGSDQSEV